MKKTNEEYLYQLLDVHKGSIVNVDDYIGAHIKITHLCNKCNHTWLASPAKVGNSGTGCPKCALANSNKKRVKSNHQFLIDLNIKNPKIEALDKYDGAHTYINFKCKVCNHEWKNTPHGVKGCPSKLCVNKNRLGYYNENNLPDKLLVYLLNISYSGHAFYKIGLTINLNKRIYVIKEELPGAIIEILRYREHTGIKALELKLFTSYTPNISFGGHTECLSNTNNLDDLLELYDTFSNQSLSIDIYA
jgi:Zn finger protein HypA/HybF involved in hydrogenase expression